MKNHLWTRRAVVAVIILPAIVFSAMPTAAQDLVQTGSLGGGSSIFVVRNIARQVARRIVPPPARPARTQSQRTESVRKIKKQYETIAKNTAQAGREKAVDPGKLNRSLPPAQASKVFAGVGEYFLAKNEYERSFEYFLEAINLDETNVTAKNGYAEGLAMKGNDLLEKGGPSSTTLAKGTFIEALKYNPNNIAANFGLAGIYADLDQQQDAIKSYEKALEQGKDLTEIYVPLGILYYQTGEIAKADDMLSKAIAKSPDSAETQFFLGLVRTSQNKLEEALAAFQRSATLDPTNPDAQFNVAETLVKLKRAQEAIPFYQKATSLKPTNFDGWVGLGQGLVERAQSLKDEAAKEADKAAAEKKAGEAKAKFGEAIDAFKKAKSIKANDWEVFAGLAESYRQTDVYLDAASAYELAALFYTQIKDFDKEVAADLYSKEGFMFGLQCPLNRKNNIACQWPAAIIALEKAVQLGNNPLDQANLGWAYYNAARSDIDIGDKANGGQKLKLAKDALEKAIANNTNQIVVDGALQNLGAVQNDLGDFAGAVKSLTPVAERHADWSFAQYALGSALFLTGDYTNAAKWFNAVVAREPAFSPALASLGNTYIKLKNGKELKRVIDQLKPLEPSEASKLEIQAKFAKVKIG